MVIRCEISSQSNAIADKLKELTNEMPVAFTHLRNRLEEVENDIRALPMTLGTMEAQISDTYVDSLSDELF